MAAKQLKKEEIQKIVLGVLLAIGVVYGYFTLLLGPLKAKQKAKRVSINALEPAIATAKSQIARTGDIEANAPKAQSTIEQIEGMMPEGAPVAWFPTLVGDFFKRQGIEKVTTRMGNEVQDKELGNYKRIAWSIELPKTEAVSLATAIAQFENELMLVEIQGITIETQPEDPEFQRVTLSVNNIVRQ